MDKIWNDSASLKNTWRAPGDTKHVTVICQRNVSIYPPEIKMKTYKNILAAAFMISKPRIKSNVSGWLQSLDAIQKQERTNF